MSHLGQEKDRGVKESIITDVRNIFRLKKVDNNTIKYVVNLFRLKWKWSNQRENNCTYLNLFELEHEEENYYKPVRVGNF